MSAVLSIDACVGVELKRAMRAILFLMLIGALLSTGCKHARPSDSVNAGDTSKKSRKASKTTAARDSTSPTKAKALNESTGKVASVNSDLRFVVIDFALNPLPKVDQRLSVFHDGQKVGEVKISNQTRNAIVAADIMSGQAQVGDEVRPE